MLTPVALVFGLFALLAVAALAWFAVRWRAQRAAWIAEKLQLQRAAVEQQLTAQRHSAAAERERIYRDLHDDLGARLLDLVYAAPTPALADQARGALQQLRAIVADAQRPATSLLPLLAELEAETGQRFATAQRQLIWEQDPALPDVALDQAATLHLARIVREAISNAFRHADLQRLRVRLYEVDGTLMCDVADDGEFDAARIGAGTGTQSMRQRAEQLGGSIAWHPGTWGGTKVTLRMPLGQRHG